MAFSSMGHLLATASSDGRVRHAALPLTQLQLHRYPSLLPVWSDVVDLGEEIYDLDFSQDATQLAVTTASKVVIVSTTPKTSADERTFSPRIFQTISQMTLGATQRGVFRTAKFGRGPLLNRSTKHMLFMLVNASATKSSKNRPRYVCAASLTQLHPCVECRHVEDRVGAPRRAAPVDGAVCEVRTERPFAYAAQAAALWHVAHPT